MKFLYKYPQRPYPYEQLVKESRRRSRDEEEYEIMDAGVFDDNRYWDVIVEVSCTSPPCQAIIIIVNLSVLQYAKDDDNPEAVSIRITAYNRGPDPADLHIIPQLWFRNTWSWDSPNPPRPKLSRPTEGTIKAEHSMLGTRHLHCLSSPTSSGDSAEVVPELLFTENETNYERLWDGENNGPYVKDAFHNHIIGPRASDSLTPYQSAFVNPEFTGTKGCAHYVFTDVPGDGGCVVVRVKLTTAASSQEDLAVNNEEEFDDLIEARRSEADEFYSAFDHDVATSDLRNITRQALAGMLW